MKVLALCGSLRQHSRSLTLLQASAILAESKFEFSIFSSLGNLPLFNPDLEHDIPAQVQALWQAIDDTDAILIASPEYAHGITGTIKNALDWLVGYMPFTGKPVAVFNPSHRAEHADAALKEILITMNAQLITEACLRIPVTACQLSAEELTNTDPYRNLISTALNAIKLRQAHSPTP
jgi:chromate reductase